MVVVVVSCATDDELARNLYDYLRSRLQENADGATENIILEGDEIVINDAGSRTGKGDVLEILSAFIKSDPDKYRAHKVTEFGDVLIVGIPSGRGQQLLEDMQQCEMCNYMTRYEEQLRLHKMTHGNVWLG